jgi:biopolymer transport protein ExbD/biopolymer transport protein TolR
MAIKSSDGGGGKPTFSEINITPLTDIFLVLLIIMMVVAPSFSDSENISLPEINSGQSIEEKDATVMLTKDGTFFINAEKVAEDKLEQTLLALKENIEEKRVIVRADEKAKSSEIMKIMRAAQAAGYEKLVVAGEPLSKKDQTDLENPKDKKK